MRYVYIAEAHYDYEGFEIIGVYMTRKDAEDACSRGRSKEFGADEYKVTKHYINGSP